MHYVLVHTGYTERMSSLFEGDVATPLASRIRPESLDEVVGQQRMVAEGGLLRKLVDNNRPTSLLFWGPPGTGKTTLARILARKWKLEFTELSAVTSGVKDIRRIVKEAERQRLSGRGSLLFIDEIHRFNKAQQDALLPHVESGTLVLIGATTENPSFEINNALLSRLQVVSLDFLSETDLKQLLKRGTKAIDRSLTAAAQKLLIERSGGDARRLLNVLEIASSLQTNGNLMKDTIDQALATATAGYDKQGEDHYNLASALIKSLRGSDQDASLYYLHRILAGGGDPLFVARRLIVFASEDIGMAAPYALTLAVATYQAVERIGMPEAEYTLTHAVMALAQSPKSRDVADAKYTFKDIAQHFSRAEIPKQVRNAPTEFMSQQGYGKGYQWQSDFTPEDGFLPDAVRAALEDDS